MLCERVHAYSKTLTHVLPPLPRFAGRDAVLLEALAPALVRRRGVVAVGAGVPLAVVGRRWGQLRGRRGPRVGVARHAVAAAVTWHDLSVGAVNTCHLVTMMWTMSAAKVGLRATLGQGDLSGGEHCPALADTGRYQHEREDAIVMSLSTDASRGGKAKWESTYGLMLPTYPPCSHTPTPK